MNSAAGSVAERREQEHKIVLVLIMNKLFQPNPVMGFLPPTPHRAELARGLKSLILTGREHDLLRWAFTELINRSSTPATEHPMKESSLLVNAYNNYMQFAVINAFSAAREELMDAHVIGAAMLAVLELELCADTTCQIISILDAYLATVKEALPWATAGC